jgi:hypothetical protein
MYKIFYIEIFAKIDTFYEKTNKKFADSIK